MANSSLIGIDLFAGAGGLSYGLSQAGFDMKLGLEMDPNSALTLKENNRDEKVIEADIKLINPTKMLKSAGLRKRDISLVAGGPPCQGFSTSNRRSWNINNPLNGLYKEYFRFVKAIKPEVFLFENVAGFKTLDNGAVFNRVIQMGKKLGYHVYGSILSAEDYGVPQKRKRVFIIGAKQKDSDFFKKHNSAKISVKDAISDLPIVKNGNCINELHYSKNNNLSKYQKNMRKQTNGSVLNNLVTRNNSLVLKRYSHIPQGGNWSNIPKYLMKNYDNLKNCHSWIYYRLKWEEPSVVISNFRKCMLIHPERNRGLSVREAARLQSFPDHYRFYGELGSQQQQVANAVPPLLSKFIGILINKALCL